MKRNRTLSSARKLRANNQRRAMLKRMHQKVLSRRKQFALVEMDGDNTVMETNAEPAAHGVNEEASKSININEQPSPRWSEAC
jgi:hypothetical protein